MTAGVEESVLRSQMNAKAMETESEARPALSEAQVENKYFLPKLHRDARADGVASICARGDVGTCLRGVETHDAEPVAVLVPAESSRRRARLLLIGTPTSRRLRRELL